MALKDDPEHEFALWRELALKLARRGVQFGWESLSQMGFLSEKS